MREIGKRSPRAIKPLGLATSATALVLGWGPSTAFAQGASGELAVSADAGADSASAEATAISETGEDNAEETSAPAGAPPPAGEAAPAPAAEQAPPPAYAGLRARSGYHAPTYGGAEQGYMSRYIPTGNQWEVTLYAGILFPSKKHNLKVAVLPVDEYSGAVSQVGFRLGYFPLSFVGAEFQSFFGGGSLRESGYSATFYGLSGHLVGQLPLASVVPFFTLGLGTLGASSELMGHDRDTSFIWGLGVKAALSKRLNLRFDFQDSLTQKRDVKNGKQTHHPAIQLGVSFVFERDVSRSEKVDSDYDGLFDADDKCPQEGALTADGCPAAVTQVEGDGDADGDGIFDDLDQCPQQAGPAPQGCPNLDQDADGVPLPDDLCPTEAGPAPSGCPNSDPDGDGIPGADDQCPDKPETNNGYKDADGCPDEMPEEVKKFTGVIPGIQFKQGTAEIDQSSLSTLDEAAKILTDFESIRIEVSGHTSSEGTEERNQELSIQRAEAVRKYFLEKGISEDRITARGAGATEPVADNATKEGRTKNRRIEFRVLSQP